MASASILVVDDDSIQLEMLAACLDEEYEILIATSGEQALEIAASALPDLILLDLMMPGMDGMEVCRRLKASPATADIPVIFLTARDDQDAEAHGLELGAVDYISKPFNAVVVRIRVRNHVALKQARDALAKLAHSDGLTGLATRRRFDEVLDAEVRRLSRTGARIALLMLDVDHFKLFNDAYGHVAGDHCLQKVAGVLTATSHRVSDLSARYGGEEFACILPETDLDGAVRVAEIICQGIADLNIPHSKSTTAPHVTVSIGLVSIACHVGLFAEDLITSADAQLYKAKAEGRNRFMAEELFRADE